MPKLRSIFSLTLGLLVGITSLGTVTYLLRFNQSDGKEASVTLSLDYLTSTHAPPSINRPFMALLSGEH